MNHLPFTQTDIWAEINRIHNNLEPLNVDFAGFKCLFGLCVKTGSLISFNGPICREDVEHKSIYKFLLHVLEVAKSYKVSQIKFIGLPPLRDYGNDVEKDFLRCGFKQRKWHTILIDLKQTETELLMGFAHSVRKNIKKAQARNVQVCLCETFDQYYTDYLLPYFALQHRIPDAKELYQQSWSLDCENIYHFWIAKNQDGMPLGFLGTYRYNGVATEIMSAITPLSFEQKIPVQDLLHYEVIKFHKKMGDVYFDIAGFNPEPESTKELNIRRFKEKWGNSIYDTSSYSIDTRTILQRILHKITRKRA